MVYDSHAAFLQVRRTSAHHLMSTSLWETKWRNKERYSLDALTRLQIHRQIISPSRVTPARTRILRKFKRIDPSLWIYRKSQSGGAGILPSHEEHLVSRSPQCCSRLRMFTRCAEPRVDHGNIRFPRRNVPRFGAWNFLAQGPIKDSGVLTTARGMGDGMNACPQPRLIHQALISRLARPRIQTALGGQGLNRDRQPVVFRRNSPARSSPSARHPVHNWSSPSDPPCIIVGSQR